MTFKTVALKAWCKVLRMPLLRNCVPGEVYLKLLYQLRMNKKLDLKNPQTFNEKLQWLKLYHRKAEYTMMVDKYAVREYIVNTIGEEYLIPLLGVWDRFEEINFDQLPDQFVLKCTHDSGGLVICKDKTKLDIESAKRKITKSLRHNYYWFNREWPYKNVKPRIIAEKYMVDESGYELKDYKFFCFNGVPKLVQVDFDRFKNHKRNIYDENWNFLDLQILYSNDVETIIRRPPKLDEMLNLAWKLSKDKPHARIDFYSIGDEVYFGEITFYHGSGMEPFDPVEWNDILGSWINLK